METEEVNFENYDVKRQYTDSELEEMSRQYDKHVQARRESRIILKNKMTALELEILTKLLEDLDSLALNFKPVNNGLHTIDWNGANCGGILWVGYKGNEYVLKYYESQDNKLRIKILKPTGDIGNFYYRMEAIELNKMCEHNAA